MQHMLCQIQASLVSAAWEQLFQIASLPAAMLICAPNPERWSNQYTNEPLEKTRPLGMGLSCGDGPWGFAAWAEAEDADPAADCTIP